MSAIKCKKCKSSLKIDTYTVCRDCNSVEFHRNFNPMELLDEKKVDIILKLLLEEDERKDRKLEDDYMDLFSLVLKAKLKHNAKRG